MSKNRDIYAKSTEGESVEKGKSELSFREISRETEIAQFRARMRLLAEEAGGVAALARKVGMKDSTLRKWVNGPSEPSRGDLVHVARETGVRVEWLATGEGPRFRKPAEISEEKGSYDPESKASGTQGATEKKADDDGGAAVESLVRAAILVIDTIKEEGLNIPEARLPDLVKFAWTIPDSPENRELLRGVVRLVAGSK